MTSIFSARIQYLSNIALFFSAVLWAVCSWFSIAPCTDLFAKLPSGFSGPIFISNSKIVIGLIPYLNTCVIHYIDIHLKMQYNCTLQQIRDKPAQSGR